MILCQNLKRRIGKINKIIQKRRVDILIYSSLIIFTATTMKINFYVGLYLLAAILLILGIIVAKFGG